MSDELPTGRIVTTTVMGVAGGAMMGASMTVGAKAGAAAGALAGPVGMVAGAAVGGVLGFSSYWVAKGISALTSNNSETQAGGNDDKSKEDDGQREPEEESEEKEDAEEDDREDDDDEESSASEDESTEESTEVSDFESQIESTIREILSLPSDAPASLRMKLYRRLCSALQHLVGHPEHRVHINREDRFLSITVPGFRPIEIPREIRENLGLAAIIDRDGLGALTLDVNAPDRPIIYRIQCTHCQRNYIGKTRTPKKRYNHHRSRVNARGRTTLAGHLNRHRRETGRDLQFDTSFVFVIVRELTRGIDSREIRNWEVFLQWLFNGRDKDGGIGKR